MSDSLPQSTSSNTPSNLGVLLVGHGTRNMLGQAEFHQLFAQFAELMQPIKCQPAFLELAAPNIEFAVQQLAALGVRRLLVVPVILFTAGHAESDIPNAVREAIGPYGIEFIGQTKALECSQPVLELSALRFRQAVCSTNCQAGCCGEVCSTAAWLMIGRGSSSFEASEKAREFCRLRQKLTPTVTVKVAFIHGQKPTVEQAMDEIAAGEVNNVVVQPHLLFSGLLMEQLRIQVQQKQLDYPHQRWTITETLGADRKLAELLAQETRDLLPPDF